MCPFEVMNLEVCEKMFRSGIWEWKSQHGIEGEWGNATHSITAFLVRYVLFPVNCTALLSNIYCKMCRIWKGIDKFAVGALSAELFYFCMPYFYKAAMQYCWIVQATCMQKRYGGMHVSKHPCLHNTGELFTEFSVYNLTSVPAFPPNYFRMSCREKPLEAVKQQVACLVYCGGTLWITQ